MGLLSEHPIGPAEGVCDLKRSLEVSEDRALRFTTLVRLLRGVDYENVFGEHRSERHQRLQK